MEVQTAARGHASRAPSSYVGVLEVYHQYSSGMSSSTVEDVQRCEEISSVNWRVFISTLEGVQYRGGYHPYCLGIPSVL